MTTDGNEAAEVAPRRGWRKWIWRIGAAVIVLVVGWWISVRSTAPARAVSQFHIQQPASAYRYPWRFRSLRIGIYNIAHGRGTAASNWEGGTPAERQTRLDEIAAVLAEEKLDVVVLNEVDFECPWSDGVNQARRLAEAAGYPFVVEQANIDTGLPGWRFRFGNAVLSRLPIVDAEVVELPPLSAFESLVAGKKNALVCTIEMPRRQRLRLVAVHLEHRSEAVRIASAKVIADLAATSDLPVICAGDFNSAPVGFPLAEPDGDGQTALSLLAKSGDWLVRPVRDPGADDLTFPADAPDRLLDWILIPADWAFLEYRALPVTWSDHRPVVATVSLYGQE